jgi:hypothetical protein
LENNLQSRIPFLAGICTAHPWSSTGKSIDEQRIGFQMAEMMQTVTKLRANKKLETHCTHHPYSDYFIIEMLT